MYTFKKNSWHVRFYKWLFDNDPTKIYKSMCPYFWTYVVIFLTLPFILLFRIGGKKGKQFSSWLESHQRDKRNKMIENFQKRCENPNLSPKEAYEIKNSKCWEKYYYYIDWDLDNHIRNLSNEYKYTLHKEKIERDKNKEQKIKELKESKTLNVIFTILGIGLLLLILYVTIVGISMIEFKPIDWLFIGKVLLGSILIICSGLLIIGIVYYIVKGIQYLTMKISCINFTCPLCNFFGGLIKMLFINIGKSTPYISIPFIFIFKGIRLIADMIYNTYKKNCPIIKWEE